MSAPVFVSNSSPSGNSKKRCYDRRQISNPLELLVAEMCARAEVRYSGVQKSLAPNLPTLALFSNSHGGTCALPVVGLSVEAIQAKVAESHARWAGFTDGEIADADRFHSAIKARR